MAAPVAVRDLRLPVLVAAAAEGEASEPGDSADGRELPAFSLARALAGEAEVPPEPEAEEVERRSLRVGMTCGLSYVLVSNDMSRNLNPDVTRVYIPENKNGLIYR